MKKNCIIRLFILTPRSKERTVAFSPANVVWINSSSQYSSVDKIDLLYDEYFRLRCKYILQLSKCICLKFLYLYMNIIAYISATYVWYLHRVKLKKFSNFIRKTGTTFTYYNKDKRCKYILFSYYLMRIKNVKVMT
jgi:hypothetical protein